MHITKEHKIIGLARKIPVRKRKSVREKVGINLVYVLVEYVLTELGCT